MQVFFRGDEPPTYRLTARERGQIAAAVALVRQLERAGVVQGSLIVAGLEGVLAGAREPVARDRKPEPVGDVTALPTT